MFETFTNVLHIPDIPDVPSVCELFKQEGGSQEALLPDVYNMRGFKDLLGYTYIYIYIHICMYIYIYGDRGCVHADCGI